MDMTELLEIIVSFCLWLLFVIGVHPHDAKSWDEDTFASIKDIASHEECVAIGECGLDFNRNFSEPDVQKEVFQKQVSILLSECFGFDCKMLDKVFRKLDKLLWNSNHLSNIQVGEKWNQSLL